MEIFSFDRYVIKIKKSFMHDTTFYLSHNVVV